MVRSEVSWTSAVAFVGMLLPLTSGTVLHHASAFESATLAAVGAARRITDNDVAQFRADHCLILRGVSKSGVPPLRNQGNPQPLEMDGIDNELQLAAAIVSRLLNAAALRDPCGEWCGGWDNAYDHYAYWKILDDYPPETRAMVILPREPTTITLHGYPEAVVGRTAYSTTAYPKHFQSASGVTMSMDYDFSSHIELPEPEIELDAGDALILDGWQSPEGLGGLGGGHLVYRFEICPTDDEAILWSDPLRVVSGELQEDSHELLVDLVTAHLELRAKAGAER